MNSERQETITSSGLDGQHVGEVWLRELQSLTPLQGVGSHDETALEVVVREYRMHGFAEWPPDVTQRLKAELARLGLEHI